MNLQVKREREETVEDNNHQHAGSAMEIMESAFGGGESRPAKLARNNDRGVEDVQPKPERDGGGGSGHVTEGERIIGKEAQVQEVNISVKEREFGEVRDPGRVDLQSCGNVNGDAVMENKELLDRVDVEQLKSNSEVLEQEFLDSNRGEENSEGLLKKSNNLEGKVDVMMDVAVDVKREEPRLEKEKEKEEKCKDDVPPLVQQLQLHSDVDIDNETNEKGAKEKDNVRERERSREKEEAVKRERREKERDRDPHRRERDESQVENEEGKAVKVDVDIDVVKKPVDERKLKERRERGTKRHRDKERDDVDAESSKRKNQGRDQEKERDSLLEEPKDKDAVQSHGVQQRKRMLRPRAPSNPSNRDSRSRFRPKDNEGQDRVNRETVKPLIYRAEVGIPELPEIWKEYCKSRERNISSSGAGRAVEIRIPAELATTANRKIRVNHLWGTDIYTDDSDIVAVLFHTGYCTPSPSLPPSSVSELRATIRLSESLKPYTSSFRNTIRSRAWASESACSYKVERCQIMQQGGGIVELEPCLTRILPFFPTLAPAASERTVTTRAASSSAHRQQRFLQEISIQYNLRNEPWYKYNMSIVADRGLKKSLFTSARLKNGEVLYVETGDHRYELAYDGERATCNGATTATSSLPQGISGVEKAKERNGSAERALEATEKEAFSHTHSGDKLHGNYPTNGQVGSHQQPHDSYRWSRCKRPLLSFWSIKTQGFPLSEEFIEVLEEALAWEEVQWSPTSVWVKGIEYILNVAQFFSPKNI